MLENDQLLLDIVQIANYIVKQMCFTEVLHFNSFSLLATTSVGGNL